MVTHFKKTKSRDKHCIHRMQKVMDIRKRQIHKLRKQDYYSFKRICIDYKIPMDEFEIQFDKGYKMTKHKCGGNNKMSV